MAGSTRTCSPSEGPSDARLTGVRNCDYRSVDDFVVRYEEREVSLSHLSGLHFYVSYRSEGPVGHTFLSFIFDERISIASIPPPRMPANSCWSISIGSTEIDLTKIHIAKVDCDLRTIDGLRPKLHGASVTQMRPILMYSTRQTGI